MVKETWVTCSRLRFGAILTEMKQGSRIDQGRCICLDLGRSSCLILVYLTATRSAANPASVRNASRADRR